MQNTELYIFVCPKFSTDYKHLSRPPTVGVDEVSGDLWQLVTAIHDEGYGLVFCGKLCEISHYCWSCDRNSVHLLMLT
jgi:hypothetical protein